MKLRGWLSWQLWAFTGAVFATGLALGSLFAAWLYLGNLSSISAEMSRKAGRVQLLEMLVQQYTSGVSLTAASLEVPPAISEAAPVVVAAAAVPVPGKPPVVTSPVVDRAPATPKSSARGALVEAPRKPVPAASKPSPAPDPVPKFRVAAAESSAAPTPPGPPQVAAAVHAPEAPAPQAGAVTSEEVQQALKFKIEGVNADKAGVAKIERDGVHLRNGNVIRPGDLFPSREKLLVVDADNDRIVTNKRQMLIFFSK